MKRIIIFLLLGLVAPTIAKEQRRIRDTAGLELLVKRHTFVAALFYRQDKSDKQARAETKQLLRSFKEASRRQREVSFASIDVARSGFERTTQRYGVNQLPTLLLFRNGNKVDIKVGHLGSSAILDLIEKHFGEEIRERLEKRADEAELRARERRARAEAAWYAWPYYDYYYRPYGYYGYGYHYPYYYRRPGVGFGLYF